VARPPRALVFVVVASLASLSTGALGAGAAIKIPLVCSRGPTGQTYGAAVTVPDKKPQGATFTVRIEGTSAGKISHTGLNYIHDMTTDYLVPVGTTYVDGSARIVANTGTPNVRKGARAWHDKGVIHMQLPAHVEEGSSFTPPTLEFDLKITGAVGTTIAQKFSQYRVTANAFVLGELETTCDPTPKPYALGKTLVVAP